ncbi:MAG: lipopolysaccharide biosynthesis protein [bacterium]
MSKHSAVYGVGFIISRLVNFILLPVYSQILPPDEYGVSAVVFTYLGLMTIVYTFGLDAAFLRFYILSEDQTKQRQIFSSALWSVLLVAGLFTVIGYFYSHAISKFFITEGEHTDLFQIGCLILFFDALAFLPFLYLRAKEKSTHFTLIKFINVIINVGLNFYYIVFLRIGVKGIFLANAWASGVTFILLLPILFRQTSLIFIWDELKELLKFGLPYLPSTLSVVILQTIDRFILERMAGLDVTGIYSAGYKLGIFMSLFVAAFRFAWHPFFLSTSKQENAKAVFAKILTYFTLLAAVLFLIISFFIDDIVRFRVFGYSLIGEKYWGGTQVVPVILLAYLFYGIYVNFVVGIYLKKKTKYLPIITGLGALANIIANVVLIPPFGMMGSAFASLIGFLVMTVALYLTAQRFYTIAYEFVRLLKIAGVVAAVFAAGYFVQGSWTNVIKILLILSLPILLYLTGFFDRRELNALKGLLFSKQI